VVIGVQWVAWRLILGWNMASRDIGWAETIALELAIPMIVDQGFNHCWVTLQGDNTGIIGAFNKGRSHNMPHNDLIQCIASYMIPNITIHPVYMTSVLNREDSVSHSILGIPSLDVTRPCYE